MRPVARAAADGADYDRMRDEHAVCQTEVLRLFPVVGSPQGKDGRAGTGPTGHRRESGRLPGSRPLPDPTSKMSSESGSFGDRPLTSFDD